MNWALTIIGVTVLGLGVCTGAGEPHKPTSGGGDQDCAQLFSDYCWQCSIHRPLRDCLIDFHALLPDCTEELAKTP